MKKIKVVHVVPMLIPGGAERMAVHMAQSLDRHRYEVSVISYRQWPGSDLESLLEESGIEVRYLGKRPGFDYRTYSRVHHALRECQPDIIHTHLHVLRYALPSMLFLKNVGFIHTVHNMAERESEPRARWIQKYAFNHGVAPVAVANEVASSLSLLYGIDRCQVIANGIPTERFASPVIAKRAWRAKAGFLDDDVLFVCVARFAPQKNHSLLLKAFAEGPAANPKARLVLVGEGDLRTELEGQARTLGIASQVHFLGLRTDVPDVLGAMDVFVLSSDYEGNPLSVIEAMAAGLPIVSTAVGGVPELFDHGKEGFIVKPRNAQRLAEAMTSLLDSGETRRAFGAAAARRARERFDISVMVREYEKLYDSILEKLRAARATDIPRTSLVSSKETVRSQNR